MKSIPRHHRELEHLGNTSILCYLARWYLGYLPEVVNP